MRYNNVEEKKIVVLLYYFIIHKNWMRNEWKQNEEKLEIGKIQYWKYIPTRKTHDPNELLTHSGW
jgi:hypothetical protein